MIKLMIPLNVLTIIILYIRAETPSVSVMDIADNLKCRLRGRMKHLRHYGSNKTADLQRLVDHLKTETIRLMEERVEYNLNETLQTIEDESKNGPAADDCYETAKTNFAMIIQSLNTTDCDNVDLSDARILQTNINGMNKNGHEIIDEINEEIIACASSSDRDFQKCLKSKLPQWRNSTRTFRKRIETLKKNSALIGKQQGDSFTTKCFGQRAGVLFRDLMDVMTKADQCIKGIPNIH